MSHLLKRRVLLVEDDANTREHMSSAVRASPYFELVDAVGTVADGAAALARGNVDVLLTDLNLPDGSGVELIRATRVSQPDILILVISVLGDERSVITSVQAGACGYLLKDGTASELEQSMLDLIDGGSPLSPSVARYVLRLAQASSRQTTESRSGFSGREGVSAPTLSPRETEVLSYLAKGCTPPEIADLLRISPHTVITHTRTIHRKLEVSTRAEAVFEAVSLGLIKL